jgi:hypothetical protein
MGLVITAVSIVGASAQRVRLGRIRALHPVTGRVAGAVVVVVGAYLLLYWITGVTTPYTTPAPVRITERLQGDIAGWLNASPRAAGIVMGALVLVVLGAAFVQGMRGDRRLERAVGAPTPPTTPVPARHEGAVR